MTILRRRLGVPLLGFALCLSTVGVARAAPSPKKGVGMWSFSGDQQALASVDASWFYTWSTGTEGISAPSGVSFVPMIWGTSNVDANDLNLVKTEGNVLLGFNEPDNSSQSHLSPQQALGLWPQLVATGLRLGSPAPASNAPQNGGWLDQFMTGASQQGLRVDFICLHWYGANFDTNSAVSELQTYIQQTHDKYNLPIWLTEFALTNYGGGSGPMYPTNAQQAAFASAAVSMLEATAYVERYAWFSLPPCAAGGGNGGCGAGNNTPLATSGGSLTSIGVAYGAAGAGDAGRMAGSSSGPDASFGSTSSSGSGSSSGAGSSSGSSSSGSSSGVGSSPDSGSASDAGASAPGLEGTVDASVTPTDGDAASEGSTFGPAPGSSSGCQAAPGARGGRAQHTFTVTLLGVLAVLSRRSRRRSQRSRRVVPDTGVGGRPVPKARLPFVALALLAGCSSSHSDANPDAGTSSSGSYRDGSTSNDANPPSGGDGDVSGDGGGSDTGSPGNDGAASDDAGSGDSSVRTRPLVLIALHGSNGLADNADWDGQWTYVRAHLDGFWGNNAGITGQEEASLWTKIAGRLLISEWDSVDKADFVSPQTFAGAEPYLPAGVVINREQVCLYTDTFADWDGTTIADAIGNYVNNPAVPAANRFQSVCTGFQPFDPSTLTGAALAAFQASAATFVEYPATAWTLGGQKDNFVAAWKATHAKGSRFIWFNSIYSDTTIQDWSTSTEVAYGDFKSMGLIQPNDVIMLMNYGGRLPSVPETVDGGAAESTTGIAYWLLHQQ